jgi:uncharacterized membrane protein YraQ (UPF0718 family)
VDSNKVINELLLIFVSIIYEALPFIVLGVVLAGLLEEFVPQQFITRILPRRRALHVVSIGLGGLLGLVFPMCECGIIPVMRRLLRKGVPLSVCVSYMLAGPIINVVVLTSTAVAFQIKDDQGSPGSPSPSGAGAPGEKTQARLTQRVIYGGPAGVVGLRAGLGFLIAFTTGMLVDLQQRRHGAAALLSPVLVSDARSGAEPGSPEGRRSLRQRLGNISETALNDFVDITAFLVLGAAIAAFARLLVPLLGFEEALKEVPILGIPLMMLFAFAFCLCSEADAFVAANFQPVNLWPPASLMAFLVLGPMLDIKLLLMYTRVFRRRLILTIATAVIVQVLVYCLALHYLWPALIGPDRILPQGAAATPTR